MAIQEQQDMTEDVPTHGYNLRKLPIKWKERLSLTQAGEITGVHGYTTIYPKTHAHIILTQMNITQGWIKYREKGNYAELKEQSSYMTKRH